MATGRVPTRATTSRGILPVRGSVTRPGIASVPLKRPVSSSESLRAVIRPRGGSPALPTGEVMARRIIRPVVGTLPPKKSHAVPVKPIPRPPEMLVDTSSRSLDRREYPTKGMMFSGPPLRERNVR